MLQVWMCGGRVLWVPCSRVGHIYRAMVIVIIIIVITINKNIFSMFTNNIQNVDKKIAKEV